jgi:hypothetical protein
MKAEKQPENKAKLLGGVTGKGWKPGQSGNPNGRPKKGLAIADILNERGDKVDPETGVTDRERMLNQVYDEALKKHPETWAVNFIARRTEGRSLERIANVTDKPIRIFDRCNGNGTSSEQKS